MTVTQKVSWKVVFTSDDLLVGDSTKCESSNLTSRTEMGRASASLGKAETKERGGKPPLSVTRLSQPTCPEQLAYDWLNVPSGHFTLPTNW